MNRVLALTRVELTLLLRNRTAAVTAVGFPIAFGLFFAFMPAEPGNWTMVLGLQLVAALGLSVYISTTSALTARRQDNTLKRLRAGESRDAEILLGILGPLVLLGIAQSAVMVAIVLAAGAPFPATPSAIGLAVLGGATTSVAVGVLTSVVTTTPEAAQFTTAPYFFASFGGLIWVLVTPAAEVEPWQLAVPGGAVAQLVRAGFTESPGQAALLLPVVALVAWTAVAWVLGLRRFSWTSR